jgi:hypothetical protein
MPSIVCGSAPARKPAQVAEETEFNLITDKLWFSSPVRDGAKQVGLARSVVGPLVHGNEPRYRRCMVVAGLPVRTPRPTRTRGVIWLVPIAVLSLLPLIAMKLVVGGRLGQMEDRVAEAQELLLESEERVADLDRALKNEKAQRLQVENELRQVRKEKEEHHRQIVKQMHAIGELKATSQADKSAAEAQISELQRKLERAEQSSGKVQEQLAAERAHEKRVVGTKSDELESYHQLIVKQRKEIERKNVIIARLADDRSRAVSKKKEDLEPEDIARTLGSAAPGAERNVSSGLGRAHVIGA